MDETFARVSKAGKVVCGKQSADGGFYCDEPLAAIVKIHEPQRYPERLLVPLPGWRADRKGIWRQTTSEADRRKHGRPSPKPDAGVALELPVIACCPKCATLQWLDADHLNVRPRPGSPTPTSRWLIRS